ncbi:MAG: hypothetical protein ABIS91_18820, partial [Nocardioides sp.]|uniref:hypothetical protein n=1 Tax=Nocardioides sp. TaxID=35761 RepID=UPI0032670369
LPTPTKASAGKREPHPLTKDTTLTKKYCQKLLSSTKETTTTTKHHHHPKADQIQVTVTGQNKLIRRL